MKKIQLSYTKYMEIQKVVSLNLSRARGEMSRKELADKAGLSYQHIYEIEEELKKPSLKVLERVSKALNVELYTLLKEADKEEKAPKPEIVPVSKVLTKMMAIPDEVYEYADKVPRDWNKWELIIELLKKEAEKNIKKSENQA